MSQGLESKKLTTTFLPCISWWPPLQYLQCGKRFVFSVLQTTRRRKISTFPSHLLLFSCPPSILQVASTRRTWSASPSRPHPAFGTRLRPGLFRWQQLSLFAQVSEGDGGVGPVRPTGKKASFKISEKILKVVKGPLTSATCFGVGNFTSFLLLSNKIRFSGTSPRMACSSETCTWKCWEDFLTVVPQIRNYLLKLGKPYEAPSQVSPPICLSIVTQVPRQNPADAKRCVKDLLRGEVSDAWFYLTKRGLRTSSVLLSRRKATKTHPSISGRFNSETLKKSIKMAYMVYLQHIRM